jgi:Domain of unknown function (DUF5753)
MVSTGNPVKMYDFRGPDAFDQLMKLEQEATRIFLNQPSFLPGVLQIAGYAAAMISAVVGLKPGDPELADRVNVRMRRAEAFAKRLHGTEPPHLWAPIDEAVLRRAVGGPAVMQEQIDRLIAISTQDAIHLAIIPFGHGAHAGLGGAFEVHEVASGEASVFFEGAHADEIVGSDQALARRYRQTVESMMASGASGAEARALLETIKSEL